jgi:excisionase family DNA binding protein
VNTLSLKQAAKLLNVHPNTVRSHAAKGVLPATKIGRDWRFIDDDLVAWLRQGYNNRARVQLSVIQKEALWRSGNVQTHTMSNSQALTERSLDVLLAQPTRPKHRSITTN